MGQGSEHVPDTDKSQSMEGRTEYGVMVALPPGERESQTNWGRVAVVELLLH